MNSSSCLKMSLFFLQGIFPNKQFLDWNFQHFKGRISWSSTASVENSPQFVASLTVISTHPTPPPAALTFFSLVFKFYYGVCRCGLSVLFIPLEICWGFFNLWLGIFHEL